MKLRALTSVSILASIVVPTLALAGCGGAGGRYSPNPARVAPGQMQPSYDSKSANTPVAYPSMPAAPPTQPAPVAVVQAEAKPAGTEHYEDYGVNPVARSHAC